MAPRKDDLSRMQLAPCARRLACATQSRPIAGAGWCLPPSRSCVWQEHALRIVVFPGSDATLRDVRRPVGIDEALWRFSDIGYTRQATKTLR